MDECDDVKSALERDSHNALCSEMMVQNHCVFRACEFDGVAAFNGVVLPHYTRNDTRLNSVLDAFFEHGLSGNAILGREWARTRMGRRFIGEIVLLCDGECMLRGPAFESIIQLPVSPSRNISGDAHYARAINAVSHYCISFVHALCDTMNLNSQTCSRPSICKF